jgi:hypothetical protein
MLTQHSIEDNRDALQNVPLIRPITAYLSLMACLFILIVANGAGLWKEFHIQPFLSAYLAVSLEIGIVFTPANGQSQSAS